MKRFFHGGIHLPGRKELAGNGAPTPAPIPKEIILPLHQHIGVPCKPLVSAGDPVWMGQKIGDGEGLCVPVCPQSAPPFLCFCIFFFNILFCLDFPQFLV